MTRLTDIPDRRYLQHWERVCVFMESQPYRSTAVPFPVDPPITARLLKRMARYGLVHHREDCQWRLASRWRLLFDRLWRRACEPLEGEETTIVSSGHAMVVNAGPDTMYINVLSEDFPLRLQQACDQYKQVAQEQDTSIETAWVWFDAPLSMYKAGKGTSGTGRGVSWGYILRNGCVEVKLRKVAVGGIIGQVHLLAETLWKQGARAALDEMRRGIETWWQGDDEGVMPHYQLSELHLCTDVANFAPTAADLPHVLTRSLRQDVYIPSREDEMSGDYCSDDEEFDPFDIPYEYQEIVSDEWDDDEGAIDGANEEEESEPVEEQGVIAHLWGKRASGFTFSPGGALMAVWYNKAREERQSQKLWMVPIHLAGGWDKVAPLTRVEARFRRSAIRALMAPYGKNAREWLDDPWKAIDHYQDFWGYFAGLPPETDIPDVVYRGWMRLAVPAVDTNRSRWVTDPVWQAIQRATFSALPAIPLARHHETQPYLERIDAQIYGLLKTRAMLRRVYLEGPAHVGRELEDFDNQVAEWERERGYNFAEEVREKARMSGQSVPMAALKYSKGA